MVSVPRAIESICAVVVIVISPLPSKDAEPATSPDRDMVLAVASVVAVSAFPVKSPVTFPVTLPVKLPVTSPVKLPVNTFDELMLTPNVIQSVLAAFLIFNRLFAVSTHN